MNLFDKVKEKAKKRKVKPCKVFGESVLVRLYSTTELTALQETFKESIESKDGPYAILADQYLDPETKKPFLTASFLNDDCARADVEDLMNIFLRMNGAGQESVEQAEKN